MKVTPKSPKEHKFVDYATLDEGEVFVFNGDIFIKTEYGDQVGICLTEGCYIDEMCGTLVTPVDAELKWSYKKPKKAKK